MITTEDNNQTAKTRIDWRSPSHHQPEYTSIINRRSQWEEGLL